MSKAGSSASAWLFVGIAIFLVLGGAVAGVIYQAKAITSRPPAYTSQAKIAAGQAWKDGEVTKTLEGAEVRRHALDRVRALHPELHEVEVTVKVERGAGPGVFSISATSPEPKYARIYLDALLEEAVAYAKKLGGDAADKSATAIKLMERASGAVEEIQYWKLDIAKGAALGGLAALVVALIAGFSAGIVGGAKEG